MPLLGGFAGLGGRGEARLFTNGGCVEEGAVGHRARRPARAARRLAGRSPDRPRDGGDGGRGQSRARARGRTGAGARCSRSSPSSRSTERSLLENGLLIGLVIDENRPEYGLGDFLVRGRAGRRLGDRRGRHRRRPARRADRAPARARRRVGIARARRDACARGGPPASAALALLVQRPRSQHVRRGRPRRRRGRAPAPRAMRSRAASARASSARSAVARSCMVSLRASPSGECNPGSIGCTAPAPIRRLIRAVAASRAGRDEHTAGPYVRGSMYLSRADHAILSELDRAHAVGGGVRWDVIAADAGVAYADLGDYLRSLRDRALVRGMRVFSSTVARCTRRWRRRVGGRRYRQSRTRWLLALAPASNRPRSEHSREKLDTISREAIP